MRKAGLKRILLGFSLAVVALTGLAGCVVYDPYPYYYRDRYYYGSRYYYGPYYGYPYYYRRDRWD